MASEVLNHYDETTAVDWNDIRLRLHGVTMNRSRSALELEQFFKALERKILDFSEKTGKWETEIRVEFDVLQGSVTGKDYDMGQTLERLRILVLRLVKVCKYLEENCAGLKEAFDKLISEKLVSKYELTQLTQTELPLNQLVQLLEVSTFRVLEGQVQNLYLKLARDCYAPGASLSQSLLHEESLRLLKFAIRDFTQCLQTAVGWRDLQLYTDTPEYLSLGGLLLMLALMLVNGLDNHFMSDALFPDIFLIGSFGTIVFTACLSLGTNKSYRGALVTVAAAQVIGETMFLIGKRMLYSPLLTVSEVVMRIVDARIIFIRYVADTVNTRRQTHWIALGMSLEAIGVAISFILGLYAGLLQGILWAVLLLVMLFSFEDVKKGVSPPAKHQGRSLRATGVCIWILFLSNSLAEAYFPVRLLRVISPTTSILFLSSAVLLLSFGFITMYVKNRICVLVAFIIGTVSLLVESLARKGHPEWIVVLAMLMTNTISVTFLVKKLPLKQAEGFWNSGWLTVLLVQLGELTVYFADFVQGTEKKEPIEFIWATTALSLMTCVGIVAAWKTLDFQLVKAKSF